MAVQLDGTTGFGERRFSQGVSIEQTFSLNPGLYELSFWINTEVSSRKGGVSSILVDLAGSGISAGELAGEAFQAENPAGVSRANAVWTEVTHQFEVSETSNLTLRFTDDLNPSYDNLLKSSNVALDDVSIAAIPEPGIFSQLALGALSLVGVMCWRRRRSA